MAQWQDKVVLVTGGSAGLGLAIAQAFSAKHAQVIIVARGQEQLDQACAAIRAVGGEAFAIAADVTKQDQVDALFSRIADQFGRLNVLVNAAGRSARGEALSTTAEQFRDLWELNFLALVRCTQGAMPMLLESSGHIVNIGSLAAKTASPYLGAYPASKFPVAAYSQQLRLELGPRGLHVLLVCPGPILRADEGQRYNDQAEQLPESARRPGGGVKIRGIDPDWLARRVVAACQKRRAELVVPGKARLLFAIAQIWPTLGDWFIRRNT